MKETFTVKEIMDGTGLTRQRVHALIQSRGIPILKEKNYILVKWNDLLQMADNPSILGFLTRTLKTEKKQTENSILSLKGKTSLMMYASMLLMESELPTPEDDESFDTNEFYKAYHCWENIISDLRNHWALSKSKSK